MQAVLRSKDNFSEKFVHNKDNEAINLRTQTYFAFMVCAYNLYIPNIHLPTAYR